MVADPYRVKEVDGVAYEVECKTIYKRDTTFSFVVPEPSLDPEEAAEEAEAANHEWPTTDLQEDFHYEPAYFREKKDYLVYFKCEFIPSTLRPMHEAHTIPAPDTPNLLSRS